MKQTSAESGPSVAAGDFEKAIDLNKKLYQKNPRDKKIVSNYVRTVEGAKRAADRARGQENFALAGRTYRLLLDDWADFEAFAGKLTFQKADLEAGLKNCRVALCDIQSRQELGAGNHGKALGLCQAALKDYPGDAALKAGYARAVDGVKTVGGKALAAGDYALAGRTYRLLLDDWADFEAFAGKLTFKKADLEAGLKNCRVALCNIQSRQELGAGNHGKALALCQAALKDYPGDAALKAGYARAVDGVKTVGGKALAAGDYALAGKVHGLLLRNFASFKGLGLKAAFARKDLLEAIKTCSTQLTNRGLAEYRKGNLKKAIATWESLLVFDPENAEIKKAVATAKAQLDKIKDLPR